MIYTKIVKRVYMKTVIKIIKTFKYDFASAQTALVSGDVALPFKRPQ